MGSKRRAFTLVELMVSVAILLAILGMVAMVFQTAGKSSSQAQANSAAYREIRQAIGHIRADLENVQRGTNISSGEALGMIAIASVEVDAYTTPQDRTSAKTSKHRADVLMLMTSRASDPYVFQNPPVTNPNHINLASNSLVVYGHADLGTLTRNGSNWTYPATTIRRVEGSSGNPSEILASQWHLARRVILFPTEATAGSSKRNQTGIYPKSGSVTLESLGKAEFLEGEADVVWMTPTDMMSLVGVGSYSYPTSAGGNAHYGFYKALGGNWYRWESSQWFLFKSNYWFMPGGSGSCGAGEVPWRRLPAGDECAPNAPANLPDVRPAFYPDATDYRTILDPNPPMEARDRAGAYFLSGCSDFKVEYTYDDPRGIQLVNSGGDWSAQPQAPIRWQSVKAGQQIVWSGLSVDPKNYTDERANTDPIRWPRAIRITIRTYGPGGGLERPVEETIIRAFD